MNGSGITPLEIDKLINRLISEKKGNDVKLHEP